MFSSLWLKSTLTLLLVALIVMGSCRMMKMAGCNARPPRPPLSRSYSVVKVTSGATIEVKVGLRGKKTATVTLADINANTWPEEAKTHLEGLTGKTIRVEQPRHGLFRATSDEAEVLPEDGEGIEARGPIVGVVFGESGACLNLTQIADGYATCLSSADKTWKAEEAKARKFKRGMWKESKP